MDCGDVGGSSSIPRDGKWALHIETHFRTYLSKPDAEPPVSLKGRTFSVNVDRRNLNLLSLTEIVSSVVKFGSKQMINMFYKTPSRFEPLEHEEDVLKALYLLKDEKVMRLEVEVVDFQGPLAVVPSPVKPKGQRNRRQPSPERESSPEAEPAGNTDEESDAEPDSESEGEPEPAEEDGAPEDDGTADPEVLEASDLDSVVVHSDKSCHNSEESSDSDYEPDERDEEIGEDKSDSVEFSFDYINPCIDKGKIFPDAETFRKVLRHHAIVNDSQYHTDKADLQRVRVHCLGEGCRWRVHGSKTRDKRLFKVKVNDVPHTCSSVNKCDDKMATSRWVQDRVVGWLKEKPNLGPTALREKLKEHYHIEVKYSRVFLGKEMALDQIFGNFQQSYPLLYLFKAELEKTNPGSIVQIDTEAVTDKIYFRRIFVALKPCIDGFLQGCRPYLALDSTHLTGRQRGQLAAACAIDGHNFMLPVAFCVFESESNDSWEWFLLNLKNAIGEPTGLVISTDCGKGITAAVSSVYPNVEHRDCFRHLYKNFRKRHKGDDFEKHMWPLALSYTQHGFNKHWTFIEKHPKAVEDLAVNHPYLWVRSKFSTYSKVDYVNNNVSESFNAWIKKYKMLNVVDLVDKLRELVMNKFEHRRRMAEKFEAERVIIPSVLEKLAALSRTVGSYSVVRSTSDLAEVSSRDSHGNVVRDVVNLTDRTCSCGKWQMTGLPCLHGIAFIVSIRQYKMADYDDNFYSIDMFRKTYSGKLFPMSDKSKWPVVDPGFVLKPPSVRRQPGRPRTERFMGSEETTKKKHRCSRCGELGHHFPRCTKGPAPAQHGGESSHQGAAAAPANPTVPTLLPARVNKRAKSAAKRVKGGSNSSSQVQEKALATI